jgi:putative SOS response-associated peptidase YedK
MCRLYTDMTSAEAIRALRGDFTDILDYDASAPPRPWKITTTDTGRVLRHQGAGVWRAAAMRWGLVPPWAPDLKFGVRCVNARAETVASLPAFREAFVARRCLVPASSWVEWREEGGIKQPYRLELGNGAPILFAGLWERWRAKGAATDTPWTETFAIITGEPSAYAARVHDRMPALIEPDQAEAWCAAPPAEALALLTPYGGSLVARPINRDIGSPKRATPEALEAIGPALA